MTGRVCARRSKELSAITSHVAELKNVAAEQLRAAAAEALAAELGKVRTDTAGFIRETVIPLTGDKPEHPAPSQTASVSLGTAEPGEDSQGECGNADAEVADYYSLWRAEQPSVELDPPEVKPTKPYLRQIAFGLGMAACLLLGVAVGIRSNMEGAATELDQETRIAAGLTGEVETGNLTPDTLEASPVPQASTAAAATAEEVSSTGWVAISSSVQLELYADGEILGTTEAGRIELSAGTHRLELANTLLGFRETISVDVQPGEITEYTVGLPNGRLTVDGPSGADVWVAGRPFGQIPVLDMPTQIGTHEVIVRHPDEGEWREFVVVAADVPAVLTIETAQAESQTSDPTDAEAEPPSAPNSEVGNR